MKKTFSLLVSLMMVISFFPACADSDQFQNAVSAYRTAETWDEMLGRLYQLSTEYSSELTQNWDSSLTAAPMEPLPDQWKIPSHQPGEVKHVDSLPEEFKSMKFLFLYLDYDNENAYSMLGEYYIRLPEIMRAKSLEEADAVLCLCYQLSRMKNYSGNAYKRSYWILMYKPGERIYQIYTRINNPPSFGYGTLYGEEKSLEDLWNDYKGPATIFRQ